MFAVAVIVALLAVAIAIAATITVKIWRAPGQLSSPGQAPGLIERPSSSDGPEFIIHGEPGFSIVSRPGQAHPGTGRKTAATGSTGFGSVEVSRNVNAICRLKGKPVGVCGCDLHKGNQRKGRPA